MAVLSSAQLYSLSLSLRTSSSLTEMLNSSSNFPSHTHTLAFTLNSGCVVSTSCQSSRECFNNRSVFITSLAVSLQDGPGQPCAHTSLSSVHSDARASRLLPHPHPPRPSASATCLKSPTPHIFWQRSAMLRTIWQARFFFPSVGGCHEGSAQSCQRERESPQKYQEAEKGSETCSRQTSTDQKPVKSLFSL